MEQRSFQNICVAKLTNGVGGMHIHVLPPRVDHPNLCHAGLDVNGNLAFESIGNLRRKTISTATSGMMRTGTLSRSDRIHFECVSIERSGRRRLSPNANSVSGMTFQAF